MEPTEMISFVYSNRPHQDGWPMPEIRVHVLGALLPITMHRAVVNRWMENVAHRGRQEKRRA